ncbi:hypothetical protein E2C01_016666 [Portunus trituberculatus]|uniref:Uncharacterized protein n=1 Tax=Portunus trituberculatus TaxID=210409 RepID=A0A5B7DRB0_PORTR|nr:hypothetical protein [Portunus trituberculatus]
MRRVGVDEIHNTFTREMLLINSQPSGGVASNNSDWHHPPHTTPHSIPLTNSPTHCTQVPVLPYQYVCHYFPTNCALDSVPALTPPVSDRCAAVTSIRSEDVMPDSSPRAAK